MGFKYRDHRGSFNDSMDTEQRFDTKDSLIEYLKQTRQPSFLDGFKDDDVTIKPYGVDGNGVDLRNGWDTNIVSIKGHAVGYTNKQVLNKDIKMAEKKIEKRAARLALDEAINLLRKSVHEGNCSSRKQGDDGEGIRLSSRISEHTENIANALEYWEKCLRYFNSIEEE